MISLGLGERFSLFQRQDHRQVVAVFDHQAVPSLQNGGTLPGGLLRPKLLGNHGGADGVLRFRRTEVRDHPQRLACRWIADRRRLAAFRFDPAIGDRACLTEQRGIIELHMTTFNRIRERHRDRNPDGLYLRG